MKVLTLTSDDENALQQVKALAGLLNVMVHGETISESGKDGKYGQRVAAILQDWHKQGGFKQKLQTLQPGNVKPGMIS